MNERSTKILLMLLKGIFSNFQVGKVTIASWRFWLQDLDHAEVERAILTYRGQGRAFPPSADEVYATVMQLRNPQERSVAEIFLAGPNGQTKPEREAWMRWGGKSRWGGLPSRDPRYCTNINQADFVWKQAQADFREIYNHRNEQNRIAKLEPTTGTVYNLLGGKDEKQETVEQRRGLERINRLMASDK